MKNRVHRAPQSIETEIEKEELSIAFNGTCMYIHKKKILHNSLNGLESVYNSFNSMYIEHAYFPLISYCMAQSLLLAL